MQTSTQHALALASLSVLALLSLLPQSLSKDSQPPTTTKPGGPRDDKPQTPEISMAEGLSQALVYGQKVNPANIFDKGKWRITVTGDNNNHIWKFYFFPTPGPPGGDFSVFAYDDGTVKSAGYM